MKLVLLLLLFTSTVTSAQNIDSVITKESLYKNVSFLAADSLKGRLTGTLEIGYAAAYIRGSFKENHVLPISVFPGYYDSFLVSNQFAGVNIIGAVPGFGSDSLIIVSAHYDHIGKGGSALVKSDPEDGDDIYNGANDDATGVAAMMELAKYYAKTKANYYTILFVAFSAEELGMLGSKHFVDQMDDAKQIKVVINLEMLGRPINKKHCYYTGVTASKTIHGINNYIKAKTGAKNFLLYDPFPEQNLKMRSDHYYFTGKAAESFTIIGTSPYDSYYHSVNDETGTIDFDFLQYAVKNIAIAIEYFRN